MYETVLNLLEAGYLDVRKRITVIHFGENTGCGNGTGSYDIKVRVDTVKLTNMITAKDLDRSGRSV